MLENLLNQVNELNGVKFIANNLGEIKEEIIKELDLDLENPEDAEELSQIINNFQSGYCDNIFHCTNEFVLIGIEEFDTIQVFSWEVTLKDDLDKLIQQDLSNDREYLKDLIDCELRRIEREN